MFDKILIANRGEIACRIIRTARDMGIQTIAVYSSADKNSQHLRQADEAFWIGEAPAKASYLNIEAILQVAKHSNAQAIHPGYGFLSENPQFAQACEQAGIVFIGPSITAMEAMASKQLAKQRLEKTKVPLTPGYHGQDQSDNRLLQEAIHIGFPILLKAAAGGGGKGMRAVHAQEEFAQALAGARREAMASFADDTMIIEKLVANPRHVEVQIMADNYGEVVHLFERDCSIQRRHQKIIEEAPAPHLNPLLRRGLAEAACEVARSINYRGAGTVEFLVDGQHFYFMEMNTRLQVEHPVTEMITGLDLVAWQIKIAANEPLPLKQEEIKAKGHALECRIYAEDPEQNFIPSIGQIHFLKEPHGSGIRIDTGIACNSTITQYYDPMIAKLITWGEDRSQALLRMHQALQHYYIGGVKTNLPFLQAICQNAAFQKIEISTGFLNQQTLVLLKPEEEQALLSALAFDYLNLFSTKDPLLQHSFAWQMHLSSSWCWRYKIDDQQHEFSISPINTQAFWVEWQENRRQVRVTRVADELWIDDGMKTQSVSFYQTDERLEIYTSQGTIQVKRLTWESTTDQSSDHGGHLLAPMPATVVAVLKKEGDAVKKGEQLLVLEAMKMEHTINAPRDGILTELLYEVGSQVSEGAELLKLS